MNWNQIKRDAADVAFSHYIRLKEGKCENCGRQGSGNEGITGLQASHFFSRRNESVRFDEENVDCLCIACHKELGTDDKPAYKAFKVKQLGEKGFDALTVRANTYMKKDRAMRLIEVKMLLKTLEKTGSLT